MPMVLCSNLFWVDKCHGLPKPLPTSYVARNDYREDAREIKDMLNKIFDKLENKVDK
jgi:hypothetical protein